MADLACCVQPRKSGAVVRKLSFGRKKKEVDLKDKATIGGLDRPSDLSSSQGSSAESGKGIMRRFSFGRKEKEKSDLSSTSQSGEASPQSPAGLMRHFSFGKKKEPKQADPARAQSQFTALDFERNQSVRHPRETGADKVVRVLSFGRGRKARGAAAASKPQPAGATDGATREANLALLESTDVIKGWLAVRLPEEYGGGGGREKLFAVFHQKAYRLRLFERADDAEYGRQGVADVIVAWARRGPRELKDLPEKPHDLHVWSDAGFQFECRLADPTAASDAQGHVQMWVDALNKARDEATTCGFVDVARPGKKGWKRRYMVYHARSQQLSLYACAAKDDERAAAMHAEQRGTLTVQQSAHHPSPAHPFMFRCYAADLASFELKCANADQLRRWLNAMPVYTVSLGGGAGGGGVSGGGNGTGGEGTADHAGGTGGVANGTSSNEREEVERVRRALLAEVASLKERLAQKAAATASPPKAAKPTGGTSGGSGKGDVSGDERSESRRSDDSDVDDDVEEVPRLQIGMSRADMMGSAAPSLTATERAAMASSVVRKELNLNEKSRRKLSTSLRKSDLSIAEEEAAAADAEGSASAGKGDGEEASGSGELDRRSQTMAMRKKVREEKARLEQAISAMQAMTEEMTEEMAGIEEEEEGAAELAELRREVAEATAMRARADTAGKKGSDGGGGGARKGSEGSAELERMRAELAEMQRREEQLQDENRKLKATTGGAMSADDDAALRDAFVEQLGRILELRREGKFDQGVFDEYNAAMVQLSEEHIRGIYQAFMMICAPRRDLDSASQADPLSRAHWTHRTHPPHRAQTSTRPTMRPSRASTSTPTTWTMRRSALRR